ncbi:MAG: alpha/beta hydrolase [Pseudonocardiaceae bacterium]
MEATTRSEPWDRAYLPGRFVPSVELYLDEYARRSALARHELAWREVPYGPDPAERLHFFPAPEPDSPLVVFVHGGYWQQLTEADSSFAGRDVVAAGAAYAALGYGLAPRVRLDGIVAMVRRAVLWLHRNAGDLGVDRERILLAGHSAGAQLVGMCLVEGWLPEAMRPSDLACAAVLMSGLYELEPVRHSSVGAAIGLSAAQAAANSLVRQLHAGLPPLVVARGVDEPTGFADQQRWLVSGAVALGVPVTDLVVAGRNHFDLPLGMGDPADPVGRALLAQVGLLQDGTGNQVADRRA